MATVVSSFTNKSTKIFHIGQEVALYTKEKFIIELKKLQSFKARDYSTALREVFIAMDELIKSPQG